MWLEQLHGPMMLPHAGMCQSCQAPGKAVGAHSSAAARQYAAGGIANSLVTSTVRASS